MWVKRFLLVAVLWLIAWPALAQNPTCPTRPVGDSSNACASTAFVGNTLSNTSPLNLVVLGADNTGVVDATAILTSAIATGKAIYAPAGTYKLSGTCPTISTAGQEIYGAGFGATTFSSTCTGHTFPIGSGVNFVSLHDFKIIRTGGAAISGQDGIHCTLLCDYANIDNIWIESHYNGFRLAGASFNKLTNSVANNNQNHGIYITNTDGCVGLQWTLENNLSQQSNGDGVRIEAVTCDASVGEIINQSTYANKGNGLRVLGTAGTPFRLQGPRVTGGFFGQDCADEIYLDTYASTTQRIHGAFIELAGTSACGVNLGTAATNVGKGINATTNNTFISIDHNILIQNSQNGIETSATFSQINNNNLRLNGGAGGAGQQSGIQVDAGSATINGNVSQANNQFGARILVDSVTASGNDFCNNAGGGVAAIAIPTSNFGPTNKCAGIGVVTIPAGSLTLSNGLNSDIAQPTGQYTYLQITGPTGAFSVGGIASGVDGRIIVLQNKTTQQMTIVNNDGSSGLANRITTLTGGNVVLQASVSNVKLIYDGTAGSWILLSTFPIPASSIAPVTGSGSVVLQTSPTINTPTITSPSITGTVGGAASYTGPTITSPSITGTVSGAAGYVGTATNDNAAAGNIGQYTESVIASGSAVSLTTATPANLTSISLTAGDWDVDAQFQFTGGTTTNVFNVIGSISTTSATLDLTNGRVTGVVPFNTATFNNLGAGQPLTAPVPPLRMSLSGTTTIYAVASSVFTTSTCTVFGILRARRVR